MSEPVNDPVEAFVAHVGMTDQLGFFKNLLILMDAGTETKDEKVASYTAAYLACALVKIGMPAAFAQYAAVFALRQRTLEQNLEDAVVIVDGTLAAIPANTEAGFKAVHVDTLQELGYDDFMAAQSKVTLTTVMHTGNLCRTVLQFTTNLPE